MGVAGTDARRGVFARRDRGDARIPRSLQGRPRQLSQGNHPHDRLARLYRARARRVPAGRREALHQTRPATVSAAELSEPAANSAAPWVGGRAMSDAALMVV